MKRMSAVFSKSMLAVALLAAVVSIPVFAAETPTSAPGVTRVDTAKAKALMAGGAVMVDARVANEYAEAHIKGAVSVPYKEKSDKVASYDASVDSFDVSKLPSDKNAAVIFSCNGPECWKSYKAALAAVHSGYKKVYWFRDGFPAWKAAGYPVE